MRRFVMTWLGVGLAAAFSLAAFLLAAEPSKQTGEQELRALVPKIVASWESFDVAKIEPYYAADADLTYFDLVPMKYNNWAEYRVGVNKARRRIWTGVGRWCWRSARGAGLSCTSMFRRRWAGRDYLW